MEARNIKKASIHYIWIGPPDSNIQSVLLMAKATANPIVFYCLEECTDYYKQKFQDSRVIVKSVESLLTESITQGDFEQEARNILEIKNIILNDPLRNKIIDRINFKEIFSLFVLCVQGGYTMDTNIQPAYSKKEEEQNWLTLPETNYFSYPISRDGCAECWMLYSPLNNSVNRLCLKDYLDNWNKTQLPLKSMDTWAGEEEYPLAFHKNVGNLIIDTIGKFEMDEDHPWVFTLEGNIATFQNFPVEKVYGNSHKHPEIGAFNLLQRLTWETEENIKPSYNEARETIEEYKTQLIKTLYFSLKQLSGKKSPEVANVLINLNMHLNNPKSSYEDLINSLLNLEKVADITPKTRYIFFSYVDATNVTIKQMTNRIFENFRNRTDTVRAVAHYFKDYSPRFTPF